MMTIETFDALFSLSLPLVIKLKEGPVLFETQWYSRQRTLSFSDVEGEMRVITIAVRSPLALCID